jgi:hypothetical protein
MYWIFFGGSGGAIFRTVDSVSVEEETENGWLSVML